MIPCRRRDNEDRAGSHPNELPREVAPQSRTPPTPLRACAEEYQCCSFLGRDLGKSFRRITDLDSPLDSLEAMLDRKLFEKSLTSVFRLYRGHAAVVTNRAVCSRKPVRYVNEDEAELELFCERAVNSCRLGGARGIVHAAQYCSGNLTWLLRIESCG